MRLSLRAACSTLALLSAFPLVLNAGAQEVAVAGDNDLGNETVVVQGARAKRSDATGLDLTLRETPQSVTVVDRTQIRDFNLNTASDLLEYVPGINVERNETERTTYDARGFDITNFQVDGIGLPLISGIQFGEFDTAIFEQVEAIRGADSMMTGVGNPSAVINYVRKRPTQDFMASVSAEYGSWDHRRFEADVSAPLNDAGTLAARFVVASQDADSYLDYYHNNRNVLYGVVAWEIVPRLTATAGYSWQDNRSQGVMWGALKLLYSDNTRVDYPVSASTAADWTFWNARSQSAFGELAYTFENQWAVKGIFTYNQIGKDARLLYASGYPDPVTGEGVVGTSGLYPAVNKQYLVDLYASGPVPLFGREHELVLGASNARNHGREWEAYNEEEVPYPPVFDWDHVQLAEPSFPEETLQTDQKDKLWRVYAAAHLDIADALKAVVGVNYMSLKSSGYSYGTATPRDDDAVSPFAGITYDLTPEISLYASYTDIFNPQSEVDITRQTLSAAHGKSYEAGIKSEWFDRRLYVTAAIFRSQQDGLAEYAGDFEDSIESYYAGVDTTVTGYEFEVAGRISDVWTIAGGWTDLSIEGPDGERVRTHIPRRTLKLQTTYSFPEFYDLKLGAAVRWQSATSIMDAVEIRQESYTVVDLLASVRLTEGVRASLNARNVGDEKYLGSLGWYEAFYAAPRSYTVGLSYDF